MTTLTKITCTRCGGSGSYSFSLTRGTVCFGCEGAGFRMVDAKKEAKAAASRAACAATQQAQATRRAEFAAAVRAELDAEFGPFADTEKGAYDRCVACQRARGCTPGDIVQSRLAA